MNPERWREVEELFCALVELGPAERAGRLEELADRALADEVRGLLERDQAGSSFHPPSGAPAIGGEPVARPSTIGPFRIERVLGSGGMGTVFLAEQEAPRRRVALKVLRAGLLAPALVERFRFEAEVLGRLDHPCIATVFASGTHTDDAGGDAGGEVPWIAMEYVEGARDLLSFASERDLSLRARVELLVRVCDAVHHGHQRGVIHRDLKPSNLLVDRAGLPRVIDFGIARATDGGSSTLPGDVLGTLRTMSPEQVSGGGAIDTRTDVYALGVVLYELVCGEAPYSLDGLSLGEAVERIRRAPVRPPAPTPLELRWILGAALAKEPEDRYPSAAALAADLSRWLAGEPVSVGEPGALYRARKFVARHRRAVALAAGALIVLVAGVVALELERREAVYAREETAREAGRTARSADFLRSVLGSLRPSVSGHKTDVEKVLGRATDGLAQHFAGEPDLEADARRTIAVALAGAASVAQAEEVLAPALDYAATLDPDGPQAELWLAIGGAHAQVLVAGGDHPAAIARADELLPHAERVWRQDSLELFELRRVLATSLMYDGRASRAGEVMERALAESESTIAHDDPRRLALQLDLVNVLSARGASQEAYELARRTRDAVHAITEKGDQLRFSAAERCAQTAARMGLVEEACEELGVALAIANEVFGDDHPFTFKLRANRAMALEGLGRVDEAIAEARASLAGARAALPEGHPDIGDHAGVLAAALLRNGHVDEGLELVVDVEERGREAFGDDHPRQLAQLAAHAKLFLQVGFLDDARERLHELAVWVHAADEGELLDLRLDTLILTGNLAQFERDPRRAEGHYREALDAVRRFAGPGRSIEPRALYALAEALALQGRYDEALPFAEEALELTPEPDAWRPQRAELVARIRREAGP